MSDDRRAIRALSWSEVDEIVDGFAALNPYARDAVPSSILKIEKYNHDGNDETKARRVIECFSISAKRYCLFVRESDGRSRIVHNSEHGLGALLNPLDQDDSGAEDPVDAGECEGRKWIAEAWTHIVADALGYESALPAWYALPAVSRLAVSKPGLLAPFKTQNRKRSYEDQIKPFNFALCVHLAHDGYPDGADPLHFHLVAPYERRPSLWVKSKWVDRYSGRRFGIRTGPVSGVASSTHARVSSYADYLEQYAWHPEPKSAGATGEACGRDTTGLLYRRHIAVGAVDVIGKESNSLDEVEAGAVGDWEDVLTIYGRTCRHCSTVLASTRAAHCDHRCRQAAYRSRRPQALRAARSAPCE
jgi:hypothetical protein